MKKKILISTGGTGGHVIPANVFFEHLKNDFEVFIASDQRGIKFLYEKTENIKIIDTPKLKRNIFNLPLNFILIIFLTIKSIMFMRRKNISILISTGGYMSLPLCISAKILNLKIYLFEPNMVLGRANAFFMRFSKKIFCYSSNIKNFPKKYLNRIIVINPLLRKNFYSIRSDKKKILEKVNLLIIGGSQGAKFFDQDLKNVVYELSKKHKLTIYQQSSDENLKNLRNFYNSKNISHQLFKYDKNILDIISNSNLCITRAGASTLSELTYLNIPYIAIPYPFAKDNHQYENGLFYKNKNCCWLLEQNNITSEILLKKLLQIIENENDYLEKIKNMENFRKQNSWKNINEKIVKTINEN